MRQRKRKGRERKGKEGENSKIDISKKRENNLKKQRAAELYDCPTMQGGREAPYKAWSQ